MKRIIFDIILFISVLISPWWISAFLVLVGSFIFDSFYEFIMACIIVYALYSIPGRGLLSSPILFSIFISILYIIIQLLKNNIILYRKQ
jgi:hypothetical protein